MAEGTKPLFTNFRTGQPTPIVTGIGTASITNSQLAGPVAILIGTASITNNQLAGPIVNIIGTSSLSLSQIFIGTASLSNDQIDNTPILIASGSLTGTQIDITNIPQVFSHLVLSLISASFSTVNGGAMLQASTDNGASFAATTASYSLFNFGGVVSRPSLLVPVNPVSVGDSEIITCGITGYQANIVPRSDGHIVLENVGSQTSWGMFIASQAGINALRIITLTATSTFDNGVYRLHGIY